MSDILQCINFSQFQMWLHTQGFTPPSSMKYLVILFSTLHVKVI